MKILSNKKYIYMQQEITRLNDKLKIQTDRQRAEVDNAYKLLSIFLEKIPNKRINVTDKELGQEQWQPVTCTVNNDYSRDYFFDKRVIDKT